MKFLYFLVGILILVYISINSFKLGVGEVLSISIFVVTLLVSWILFKKDLTGMFFTSMLLGFAVEWITEAYWDYSMKVYLWRDISLFIIMGWGYSFTFFVLISDFVLKKIIRQDRIAQFDRRILLCDAILSLPWFIGNELFAMKVLHLWKYSACAHWNHIVPILNYPWEGVVGTVLFGTVLPSFVRFWEKEFKLTKHSTITY